MEPRNHSADVLPLKLYRHLPISLSIYLFIYLSINQYERINKPNASFIPCCYAYTDQVVRIKDVRWHSEFHRKLWKNYNKIKLKIRMNKNGKLAKTRTWRKADIFFGNRTACGSFSVSHKSLKVKNDMLRLYACQEFIWYLRANVCKNRAKSKFRGHSQKIIFAHILSIDRHK